MAFAAGYALTMAAGLVAWAASRGLSRPVAVEQTDGGIELSRT
ncbi:hypothetical protein [Streptomyces sp. WM6378]|nr:hypothetical protein [Streptomyces sp. WM6378]